MISLNATALFPKRSNSPAFTGDKKTSEGVATPPLQNKELAQDEWRRQVAAKRAHEESTKNLLKQWNEFKVHLAGYSATAVQEAVEQMTYAMEQQVKLATTYAQNQFKAGAEKGFVGVKKDNIETKKDSSVHTFMKLM